MSSSRSPATRSPRCWATPPPRQPTGLQYFEMFGSRALVVEQDGKWWKAVTRHIHGQDFDDDRWELYDLSSDPSECSDRADDQPKVLEELIGLWWEEAERHGVLPLGRPHDRAVRREAERPLAPPHQPSVCVTGRRSHRSRRRPPRPRGEGHGIWPRRSPGPPETTGLSGLRGAPAQGYRCLWRTNGWWSTTTPSWIRTILESELPVPQGRSTLAVSLRRTSRSSGVVSVAIDGIVCGRAELPLMMRSISLLSDSIGFDHGSPVSQRYEGSFPFTGEIHEVVIELGRQSADDVEAAARTEMARQ